MTNKKKFSLLFVLTLILSLSIVLGLTVNNKKVYADEQIYPTNLTKTYLPCSLVSSMTGFTSSISARNMSLTREDRNINLSLLVGTGETGPYWERSFYRFNVRKGNQVKISAVNGDRVYGVMLVGYSSNVANANTGSSYVVGQTVVTATANVGEVTHSGYNIGWTGNAQEVVLTFDALDKYKGYEFERIYIWTSPENIPTSSDPVATADVSALVENFNTSDAKTVTFGKSTTYNSATEKALTWKVVGYNGNGVSSKPGTITLMSDEQLRFCKFRDPEHTYEATSDGRVYNDYGVSLAHKELTAIAGNFSTAERDAIYKRALFDSVTAVYDATLFVPSAEDIYNMDETIAGTVAFSTRSYTYDSNSKGCVLTYTPSGWNKNTIYYGNEHMFRPLVMIDLSKVEGVNAEDDGTYTLKFATPPHEHNWEYSFSNNNELLTATCSESDCPASTQQLSLNIESKDFDNMATPAVVNTNNWQAEGLLDVVNAEVKYVGISGTNYPETTSVPVNAGTYKASLTVDGYTVEKVYEIRAIDVDLYTGVSNPSTSTVELFKSLNQQSYGIQFYLGKAYSAFEEENITYNGNSQQVVRTQTSSDGVNYKSGYLTVDGGKIVFSVGSTNGPWTMTPSLTDAGLYKLYWKLEASNGNFIGTEANEQNYIYAHIMQLESAITAPPTAKTGLVYNGAMQELINAGSATGGVMVYRIGRFGEFTPNIPAVLDANVYDIYYKVDGGTNYAGVAESESNKITVTIDKANRTNMPALTKISHTDVSVEFEPIEFINSCVIYGYSLTSDGEYTFVLTPVITGLNQNTTYYFKYMVVDSINYYDYTSSAFMQKTNVSDEVDPVITGASENVHYCTPVTLTIVEDNLISVTLDGADVTNDLVDGKLVLNVKNTAQTVVVTDISGNTAEITVKVLGHIEGSWIVDTVPKIGVVGAKHTECTVCHTTMTTGVIPALSSSATEDASVENTDAIIGENAPTTTIKNNISEIRESVLSKEDEQAIANGATVEVYISVEDISSTIDTATVNKVKQVVHEDASIVYLDLTLYKKVGDSASESVHTLNEKIKISVIVPDSIKAEGRVYQVVRVHDGVAEIIDGEYNAETNEFTFETDKFSTYALTYVIEDSSLGLIIGLSCGGTLLVAGAVVSLIVIKKRNKKVA